MLAADVLKALWIFVIFLGIFFGFPTRLFYARTNAGWIMAMAGNWARIVLGATIAVVALAGLRVFNATTVIVLLVGGIGMSWLRRRAAAHDSMSVALQEFTLGIIRWVETWQLGALLAPRSRRVAANSSRSARFHRWSPTIERHGVLLACFAAALTITVVVRSEHALRELRFDQPGEYGALLRARELMLNMNAAGRPLIFPALVATTSLVSAVDPMEVTRFLSPVLGVLLVLAAGWLVHVCAEMGIATLVVMYCLGVVFPITIASPALNPSPLSKLAGVLGGSSTPARGDTEFQLGLLFLILALALLADWYANRRGSNSLVDVLCCVVLVAIISQFLLLVLMLVAAVLLFQRKAGLVVLFLVCYGLAAYAILAADSTIVPNEVFVILPVTAAIAMGLLIAFIEARLTIGVGSAARLVVLIVCLGIIVFWAKPQRRKGQCLEYETAARQTRKIARLFPRLQWAVAAPVEQLPETLGLGAYEDLAGFVGKYQQQVAKPGFRFQGVPENLFVYVEKVPFQIFSREPETVSFSVMADSTYSHYRSPGGRASLESAALRLCESYKQSHGNTDVFFEDENLRIYHIRQAAASVNR